MSSYLEKINYYAYEIDKSDIDFLNRFFKVINVNGRAQILNINNLESLSKIPHSDIIFMFKLLDLIDKKDNNLEKIILLLMKKTKYIVVSFSTKTLSGKDMKLKRRTGFEYMLKNNDLKFDIIDEFNEIFYVIYD